MRRACLVVALTVLLTGVARAAPPMETSQLVDGGGAPIGTPANPFMVGTMPFTRSGDPFILPATQTAQQYTITQPPPQ